MNEEKTMAPSSVVCTNCGGQLEFNETQEHVECPYCGAKYPAAALLNESDTVKVEKIRAQAARDTETTRMMSEAARMKNEAEKEQRLEEKADHDKFKKSKFSKVLIIFGVISLLFCMLAFGNGQILSGIFGIAMTAMFFLSWLLGMQIIKEKKRGIHNLTAIIGFALIVPFLVFLPSDGSNYSRQPEEFIWEDLYLHDKLPEPEKLYGYVSSDSDSRLDLTLSDVTEHDYKVYRERCVEFGYTIEADNTSSSYSAYNEEGYALRLSYYDYDKKNEMDISLNAPDEMEELEWPSLGLGAMLPVPESTLGQILWDRSTGFAVTVANMPMDKYKEYVKACEDAGFTLNHSKSEKLYQAENGDGYKLTVEYRGFNQIRISIEAPEGELDDSDDDTTTSASEESENSDSSSSDVTDSLEENPPANESESGSSMVNGMRAEFKEAMDSYEAFFDEYIAFMKKYIASDGTDFSLLSDYTSYMSKYSKAMEDLDAWEGEEMNDVELAYYIEVQSRINKKLADIATE